LPELKQRGRFDRVANVCRFVLPAWKETLQSDGEVVKNGSMEPSTKSEVLAYMRLHRYVVIATVAADGAPQSALINIASTNALEIIFDTLTTSRKHANLQREPRAAITFSGPDDQTLQLEGVAHQVAITGTADYDYREAYYAVWPDGRDRVSLPTLAYWRIVPKWARYSDYARGPLVAEFHWDAQ
jgi:general stress protein 26